LACAKTCAIVAKATAIAASFLSDPLSQFYTKPQQTCNNKRTSIEGITIPFEYNRKNHPVLIRTEGEKNHKKGGLNCVFKNFSFLRSEKLFPDSESEIVQSLSAADNSKRTEKERTQAIIQVPSTNRK